MKRLALAFLPLLLWAAAVLVVGTVNLGLSSLPTGADKVGHFIMYGVGGALAAWAGRKQNAAAGAIALLFVALVGAVDELRQGTLSTRDADFWDWVADITGAVLFYLAVWRLPGRNRRA